MADTETSGCEHLTTNQVTPVQVGAVILYTLLRR